MRGNIYGTIPIPKAMAAGDFSRDGMIDLIVRVVEGGSGALYLFVSNPDYPDVGQPPFFPVPYRIATHAPEDSALIFAGDFNSDGRDDVA